MTLVLLLVYCKSFNVLSAVGASFPKASAKLRRLFGLCKFSAKKIFLHFRRKSVQRAECLNNKPQNKVHVFNLY